MITAKDNSYASLSLSYPLLYIKPKSGLVVLFTSQDTGTCIIPGETACKIGEIGNDWDEVNFVIYRGEITLKNS